MKMSIRVFCNLTVSLFLVLLVSCNPEVPTEEYTGQPWEYMSDSETGFDEQEINDIYRFIVYEMNTTGAMIVRNGKVIAEYGDIDELSYLASCRKSILSLLYGKYVADGTIDLSLTLEEIGIDDIGGLLDIEKDATVEHLITARSGIYHPASNAGDNSADAPERGSQKPGEYFLYNNWDFNAAGAAFEKLTGKNIYDEIGDQLAIPLGFEDWDRDAQQKSGDTTRSKYRAYHIWLSTRDMAKVGQLMLQHGEWNGKQIIDRDWADRIISVVTPLVEMNPERFKEGHFGYGYMWWLYQGDSISEYLRGAYSAMGAYGQYITVIPALDMVVSHKTKAEYGRQTSSADYEKLLDMIITAQTN